MRRDLGLLPVTARRTLRAAWWYGHLQSVVDTQPDRAVALLAGFAEPGLVKLIKEELHLEWIPGQTDISTWKRACRLGVARSQWRIDLDLLALKSSTRLYRELYPAEAPAGWPSCQEYLMEPPGVESTAAKMLFALRCGSAPLQATLCRQTQVRTATCPLCKVEAEDTSHFMLRCAHYDVARARMWRGLNSATMAPPF
jgi:hypothetical protein